MASFLQSAYETATHSGSDNPDIARRGRLLNTLLVGMLVLTALFIPLETLSWRGVPSVLTVAIILAGLALGVVALQISRRGDPRLAAYLMLGTFWAVLTGILLIQPDAATALAFLPYMYGLPVVVAGLTVGRWAPFGFTGLAMLALLVVPLIYPPGEVFARDAAGRIQSQGPLPVVVDLAQDALYLFLLALCSFLFERTLAAALQDAGRRATDVAETRVELARQEREQHLAAAVRRQAADLAETVQQQSATISQQETAVQEVTTTVEALAATAREISTSAHHVSAVAARVLGSVEQGQASVETASDSVAYLGERVVAIGERVEVVDAHVRQIGGLADLLADVAGSIHLLALNAAIEAAGAGVYGARFEVVAREVRELADRVRAASEQVQSQVLDIQTATASALVSTTAGQAAAEAAIGQSGQTRAVHLQIHYTAEQANGLAAQIALGTDRQQEASAQVLATLRHVGQAVQDLARGSGRVAAAATELSALAGALGASPTSTEY